jgi:hypothetical protein
MWHLATQGFRASFACLLFLCILFMRMDNKSTGWGIYRSLNLSSRTSLVSSSSLTLVAFLLYHLPNYHSNGLCYHLLLLLRLYPRGRAADRSGDVHEVWRRRHLLRNRISTLYSFKTPSFSFLGLLLFWWISVEWHVPVACITSLMSCTMNLYAINWFCVAYCHVESWKIKATFLSVETSGVGVHISMAFADLFLYYPSKIQLVANLSPPPT